jgi:hypothetical protein
MWFEGKWVKLEDIMLSEVSQDQKWQKPHVFSDMWKIISKINIYTKPSMIIHKLRSIAFVTVELLWNSGQVAKEKRMIEHQ